MGTLRRRVLPATVVAWSAVRIGLGAVALALPGKAAEYWTGSSGRGATAAVLGSALGGRDIVLGAGMIAAVVSGRDPLAWSAACAAADATDGAATAVAYGRLPHRRRDAVLAASFGSAAFGTAVAGLLASGTGR
jgi:hypothetical protein